jgi:hypothetical protein
MNAWKPDLALTVHGRELKKMGYSTFCEAAHGFGTSTAFEIRLIVNALTEASQKEITRLSPVSK